MHPEAYVVKPQREGGGNNVFGADVAALLRRLMLPEDATKMKIDPGAAAAAAGGADRGDSRIGDEYSTLRSLVLMQRIRAREQAATLVRDGELQAVDVPCLCEMGVYSWVVATGRSNGGSDGESGRGGGSVDLVQGTCGHLVRTKTAQSDEGGVAAGYAVIDSPLLVEV